MTPQKTGSDDGLIERLAEWLWSADYPTGGSVYRTYESTPFHDKENYCKEARKLLENTRKSRQPEDDLTKCPKCGGYADNGFDRCDPPSAYYCSKCQPGDDAGFDVDLIKVTLNNSLRTENREHFADSNGGLEASIHYHSMQEILRNLLNMKKEES